MTPQHLSSSLRILFLFQNPMYPLRDTFVLSKTVYIPQELSLPFQDPIYSLNPITPGPHLHFMAPFTYQDTIHHFGTPFTLLGATFTLQDPIYPSRTPFTPQDPIYPSRTLFTSSGPHLSFQEPIYLLRPKRSSRIPWGFQSLWTGTFSLPLLSHQG